MGGAGGKGRERGKHLGQREQYVQRDSKVQNHGTVDELRQIKCSWNTSNREEERLS